MKIIRCLLSALAIALGAPHVQAEDVVYPPGSRVGLVPPSGMAVSTSFIGFEDLNNHVAVILAALPAEAYAALDKSASAEALKRQGVAIEKREEVSLPTGKAFLVIERQEVERIKLRKWTMVGSSPDLTALVTALVPDSAKGAYSDAAIRTALASFAIRATVPVEEQLGLLPFKVGELAGFHVAAVLPGRELILADVPAEQAPQPPPHIRIAVSAGGPAQSAERDTFAREAFIAIPNVRDVRVTSSESLRIAGQPGHQIVAQARDPSGAADLTIVQWVRFLGGGYIHLVGLSRADAWPQAYPRFRAVRDGIDPR